MGTAVPRGTVTSPYRFYSYYGGPFGFGLGVLSFPYYGYGAGYSGLGYRSFGGWPYGAYPSYGYAPSPFDDSGLGGRLRLKVQPRDAEVYVDGDYAGIVDDFDGHFQHLDLTPGPHHIHVRAAGYQPLDFDVDIQFDHKTEYRGVLVPMRP